MKNEDIHSLTGLRGLAAWWVVIYHFRDPIAPYLHPFIMKLIERGYLAVDLFFILSGFVIYLNYKNDFRKLEGHVLKIFFVKRFARIYPLHITLLILYLVNPLAIYLFSKTPSYEGRYEIGYYFMSIMLIQNWGFSDTLMWNIPAWSISTETAAYIIFPFVTWAISKINATGRLAGFALFTVWTIFIIFTFLIFNWPSLESNIPHIGIFRCVLQFILGMLLCQLYINHGSFILSKSWLFLVTSAFVLALGYLTQISDFIFIPIAYALLLLGFINSRNSVAKVLGSGAILYLGTISYSTYLAHYFIKDWVKFLSTSIGLNQFFIYISITFVMSIILFNVIENPGRRVLAKLATNNT